VNVTPLTCPPSPPESAPTELPESCDVATFIPEAAVKVGGPVVRPVNVTVNRPAGTEEDAVVTITHEENQLGPIINDEALNAVELTVATGISAAGAELLEKKPLG
jgi:hypothetical protein